MVTDTGQGWAVLAAMTILFVLLWLVAVHYEQQGNPVVAQAGADIARARAALGWEPATDVREGLRAEFEWVLEHSRMRRRAVAASG